MIRFLTLLALCFALPVSAGASDTCIKPTSVMFLQGPDSKRLELARSLKAYLKSQNQDGHLATAIYKASIKTGVDFELMVLKAKMESDLGRLNFASTSSARGTFQYIEPTWLTLIRRYGDKLGYPHYAEAIERSKYPGVPTIKNSAKKGGPFLKSEILALRHDPEISAMIKAYQIKEETNVIKKYKRGARVTSTDHYIVHMLGLSLAKEFYDMRYRGSVIAVAKLGNARMREAARLNRVFFYHGQRPLTAREAYVKFEQRVRREFNAVQKIVYKKKVAACVTTGPPPPENVLEQVTPLCSGYRKDLLQPLSLHATLHPLHPCARVRTH